MEWQIVTQRMCAKERRTDEESDTSWRDGFKFDGATPRTFFPRVLQEEDDGFGVSSIPILLSLRCYHWKRFDVGDWSQVGFREQVGSVGRNVGGHEGI